MGRPKVENPTTSKDRMKKLRSDPVKRAAEQERQNKSRKRKMRNSAPLTQEEYDRKKQDAAERKRRSRAGILSRSSRQKIMGAKTADKNRKRKARDVVEDSTPKAGTLRMREHRQKMRIEVASLCGLPGKRSRRVGEAGKKVAAALDGFSPVEKVAALEPTLTPRTRRTVNDSFNQEEGSSLNLFTQLSKRRDKISNCTRQLILGNMSLSNNISKHHRKSINRAKRGISVGDLLKHYRSDGKKEPKPPTETQKMVLDFYNKDDVSRVLPYKKLTRRVKDHNGVYQRVAVRVMEVTLRKGFETFKNLHPDIKISRRTFERLRPKNIRLSRCAQRLQCGCTYHQNIEYVRKACHHLLILNGKESTLSNNETLVDASLCDAKSLKCIVGRCEKCKQFPKIDKLGLPSLKCSKDCIRKGKDCKDHTIKVRQFEQTTYVHKGTEKKKIALVDKFLTPEALVDLLKSKLANFPQHRFNVKHTGDVYDEMVSNLDDHTVIKVHDFSENYTCLLPEEIQSLHWVQETATLYPVVVLRKVGDDVREDHINFISNDKKHDVPFVEMCNTWLHQHYKDKGLTITHDVEYNDGCSSQFKCIRAFAALACRPIKTTRIYTETSHGKSKSDGVGGVVKCYASRSVCSEKTVMRDAKEFHQFCHDRLQVLDAFDSPKPMLNRIFHFISIDDVEEYRSSFPDHGYKYIKGTLKIHQVVTSPSDHSSILYREFCCVCPSCFSGDSSSCNRKNQFKDVIDMITFKKHVFQVEGKRKKKLVTGAEDDSSTDLNEDEIQEREQEEFMESEASKVIQSGDIALIKTGDDHPYYLLKLTTEPYETESAVVDDYGHDFPPLHRIVEGNYLERHTSNNDGDVYYLDTTKTAFISGFCVVGNCPPLQTVRYKRKGKLQDMYMVDHDLHQALCEIVNLSDN